MINPSRTIKYMGKDEPRCAVCTEKIKRRQYVRPNEDGTLRHVHCYKKSHHPSRRNMTEKTLDRKTRSWRKKTCKSDS